MPSPRVLLRSRLLLLASRKARIALAVGHYTGVWSVPSHPLLRSPRFCWSSTASKGTVVANHV